MNSLRQLYLLDPDVIFLNHGSFGATPRPVFETYQQLQRQLELEPVHFTTTILPELLYQARQVLGNYLNADAADLVFVPNATYGVNVVARSLDLGPGDEVLATDHEYGACLNTWTFLSQERGFTLRQQPLSLPGEARTELADQLWQGVNENTRIIFLSHITSFTATHLPVKEICARARAAGILTLIDGAHAPGQIDVDLADINADFYTGNMHKWLCSPKGAAFLHARGDQQHRIKPLVVSWGWGPDRPRTHGSDFLDYLQLVGTNDHAAALSVPAAIQFQAEHNWPAVRERCHALLRPAIEAINDLTGLADNYGDHQRYHQMAIASLPPIDDLKALKEHLYQAYRVQVPLLQWGSRQFIRISVQAYNSQDDIDALLAALGDLLPRS